MEANFFSRDYNDFLGIKRRILIQMSVINFCKIVHIHKLKLQPCRMKIVEEAPLNDFVNLNHKKYRIFNMQFPTFLIQSYYRTTKHTVAI